MDNVGYGYGKGPDALLLLIVVVVIENVRLRVCTKTGTILTNTIQFLFESYPILM